MSLILVRTGPSASVPISGNFWRESSKSYWSIRSLKSSLFPVRSTALLKATNILSCDALIAYFESRKAAFDIIAIDFKKAFDKVPHDKPVGIIISVVAYKYAALVWKFFLRQKLAGVSGQ